MLPYNQTGLLPGATVVKGSELQMFLKFFSYLSRLSCFKHIMLFGCTIALPQCVTRDDRRLVTHRHVWVFVCQCLGPLTLLTFSCLLSHCVRCNATLLCPQSYKNIVEAIGRYHVFVYGLWPEWWTIAAASQLIKSIFALVFLSLIESDKCEVFAKMRKIRPFLYFCWNLMECYMWLERWSVCVFLTNCRTLILPCQSFCEAAREGCEPVLQMFNASWPEFLRCSQFSNNTATCYTPRHGRGKASESHTHTTIDRRVFSPLFFSSNLIFS